jgi:hypothetical protein
VRKLLTLMSALVLVAAVLLSGCSENPASITDKQDRGDRLLAKPLSYGNCLSMPVIFAENHGLTGQDPGLFTGLRGTPGVEDFIEPYEDAQVDGYQVYRNPSVNEWCADWADGSTWGEITAQIDWADNIVRQTWTDKSKVRVEVVLFAEVDPAVHQLTGYNMYSLGGAQLDEVFVTNTTTYTATTATVYSNVARLTIEKLDAEGGNPVLVVYDSPCYERYFVDGPSDAYSAEVNMGGKCIYGFNWDVRDVDLTTKSGWYRLTFSLDPSAEYSDPLGDSYYYPRNTRITSLDPGDIPGYSDPENVLYPPALSEDGYSSTLEVFIKPGRGGSKKRVVD